MSYPQNHSRRTFCLLLLLAAILLSPATFAETNSILENPAAVQPTNSAPAAAVSPDITGTNILTTANQRAATVETSGTNSLAASDLNTPLPNVAGSMFRVLGMLTLVLALFLGGVWLFRNWQRLTIHRGNAPKLNVLETRSLGGRHAIFVVGYENERFLISSSPAGINMLTHLASAEASAATTDQPATPPASFATTLAQVLKGKQS